jgi:hypothetical protein
MTEQRTSKDFYRHSTGEIYAIEMAWDGTLIGSCGPLTENALKDLDSYDYSPDRNDWIRDQNDKLTLIRNS